MINNSETEVRAKVSSLKQSDVIFPYLKRFEALAKKLLGNLERGWYGISLLRLVLANIIQISRTYNRQYPLRLSKHHCL
jgi:hypothetical protein